MTIAITETLDRQQWDDFLTSQPRGHLLQSYEWGELNTYLGGRTRRLAALENGRVVGVMQLSIAPVPIPVSIPGLHPTWLYCSRGPTVESPDSPALAALIESAHALARRERAVVLRLEPNIADDDPQMDAWLAAYRGLGFQTNPIAIHGRRSWVLDIRPDADFDAYYQLLEITSERDAFFIHSKDYHKEILRTFAAKGDAVLYLAEHEGEPLAAKMLIRFGDWCWDMFGASSNNKRNLKATYLLQFRCFQWAQSKGCSYFDFRTIPEVLEPGEEMWGVYEYKKGFGGFSRLNIPTQDYVYRPLIYSAWRKTVEIRRARRHEERKKVELERAAKGKQEK